METILQTKPIIRILLWIAVIPMKSQYVKATIKAGQTFRILAVFEDDRSRNQKNSSLGVAAQTDREKIRGRYVQILSETRQVIEKLKSRKFRSCKIWKIF